MKNTTWAHVALFLVNALYGANNIISKDVMPNYITPNVFISFRVLGATLLFWLIILFTKTKKIAKADILKFAICGLFGVAINQLCFFHGLNLSSSINAGVIMTLNPIMVAILAFLILKEKLTIIKIIGISIGAIGTMFLILQNGGMQTNRLLGDVLLFVNAASYAMYLILAKPLMKKYSPLTVTTYVFTFGTLYVLLFPPTMIDLFHTNFQFIPHQIWIKIAFVVVGVTFATYLLTMFSMKYLSATTTSIYIYLQPILVIVFAYLFYSIGISSDNTKEITWIKILWMLVIFVGVYLVIRPKKQY